MPRKSVLGLLSSLLWLAAAAIAATPVKVEPVEARHGMVVAGHPQAAQIGVDVLQNGGNAIDAAVAVSMALGVAEPYASGLGGKLMLLYHEASSGKIYAIDGMDAAGSVDVAAYLKRPEQDRSYGYGSVCVPGLTAALWLAHQKWGAKPWSENLAPAIQLARGGFDVLPKTRDFFVEQEKKLRRGDDEIANLYLPGGQLPPAGSRLANPDLANTLEIVARNGCDGFYRGPVAQAIVAASQQGGGALTLDDFAHYEARLAEPIGIEFHGYHIVASPPPTSGAPLFLTILKALEDEPFAGGPLRAAVNLDRVAKVWHEVEPLSYAGIADVPQASFNFEKMVAPDSIDAIRARARKGEKREPKVAHFDDSGFSASAAAATTHFVIVDGKGNIVCATQSLSLHFGAGVVVPGTGIVLNDSMSNFSFTDPKNLNYITPGKRPRSTIAPTLVLHDGKPIIALGIPGSARIPTALLQVLLDRLVFNRPLADAIGDTRFHLDANWRKGNGEEAIEAEQSFPASEADALRALGWKVNLTEVPGTGRYFGGINAVELRADGMLTGFADPRRTNAAVGY
jgi:gamma-glutamyltranspeptidase/glutathione hydrolase